MLQHNACGPASVGQGLPPQREGPRVQESTAEPAVAGTSPPEPGPTGRETVRQPGRWPLAMLAGVLLALPLGWLLAFGALLPFFLGLFFFLLFGLVLGAAMYRVGRPARPLSRAPLLAGTACVVLALLAVSLWVEARSLPHQVAIFAREKIRKLPEGLTREQFLVDSAADVTRHLNERFPPGGVVGYVRWCILDSRLEPPVGDLPVVFKSSQPRFWWLFRVVASIALLGFGIHSQAGELRRPADWRDRAGAAVNPLSKI